MSNDLKAPTEALRPRLGTPSTLARFALIGVALAAVAGTFAYLGGWFTPNELTPARLTDAFEQVDGIHPGFRRNHAKGVGVAGFFESNGNGVRRKDQYNAPIGGLKIVTASGWFAARPSCGGSSTLLPPAQEKCAENEHGNGRRAGSGNHSPADRLESPGSRT
ncbi:MAG TPA: hypothetical protein VEL76_19475 [Gemmataceae bacterium]|nr:hypothetical protein [Gemmataceae bacterium]